MALSNKPSRNEIWAEMEESTYRNGGLDKNSLKNMHAYIFGGDGSGYSRNDFGNLGRPSVSNLIATGEDSKIDVDFYLDNNGGLNCTFIAQVWEETASATPSPYWTINLGNSSTEGNITGTITSLGGNAPSNGTTYEIRVTAYNKFNNGGNYDAPRGVQNGYDWTNTDTAKPEASVFSTPGITTATIQNLSNKLYVELATAGDQSDIELDVRINSSPSTITRDCDKGVNTTSPEIIVQIDQFVQSSQNDIVEVRARSIGAGKAPSAWTNWTTATYGTVPSCPL